MIFIVFLLAAVLGPLWGQHLRKQKIISWQAAAAELGLDYHDLRWRSGELTGTIRGVRVHVSSIVRGSGNHRKSWTSYSLGFPSVGPAVEMEPENLMSGFKALIGMKGQDIIVGDQAFDNAVQVQGSNPAEIKRFLSPARRAAAMTVFQNYQYGKVSASHISAETRGEETDAHRIVHNVRRLLDIAIVVSAPTEVDLALRYQADGQMEEAVTALHAINESQLRVELPNSFTQLLEAEALMATSDGLRAKKALDGLAIGTDDELDGWRDLARAHPSPPVMPTDRPVVVEPTGPGLNLNQQVVIDDLFTSHRQSYETEDYFLNTYHGQKIRWTGTVERTREFRYDSVFEGTGQRAIVKIGIRGEGVLVTSTVDAVVHFPSDLVLTEDQEITFEGLLVRLDFYMRNLYVAAGRMV